MWWLWVWAGKGPSVSPWKPGWPITHLDSQVVLPVIGEAFVKLSILLLGDVIRVAGPNRLGLVQLLLINIFLLDFLSLFLLAFVSLFLLLIRAHILNFGFLLIFGC